MLDIELLVKIKLSNKKEKQMIVEIAKNCTGCGLCESINSEVFSVNEISHVNQNKVSGNEQDCMDAAAQCPVGAIKIH